MRKQFLPMLLGLGILAGCANPYPPTPRPDYTIRVMPSPGGMVAIPPSCPGYSNALANPFDQQPLPQFGCASARNLAMMIERPEDLVGGREMGPSSGTLAVGAMKRYNNNQTRGLLWTGTDPNLVANTTAPVSASPMTGDQPASSGGAAAAPSAP